MKKIVIISTLLSAAFLAGCGSTAVQTGQTPTGQTPAACTMDAKACPDGTYVGRQGPNCEFAPCSGETGGIVGCGTTPNATCAGK
jgi:hypothetical protein